MDNQFLTTLVLLAVSGSITLTTKRELQAQLPQRRRQIQSWSPQAHLDPVVNPDYLHFLLHCNALCRIGAPLRYRITPHEHASGSRGTPD